MKIITYILTVLFFFSSTIYAEDADKSEIDAQNKVTFDEIKYFKSMKTGNAVLDEVMGKFMDYAKETITSTRANQDSVRDMANQLIYVIVEMKAFSHIDQEKLNLIEDNVYTLLAWTNERTVIDTPKLARDLQKRIVNIGGAAAKLATANLATKSQIESHMRNFETKVNSLTYNIVNAKKFNLALGVSYSYLPEISYMSPRNIKFSDFFPNTESPDDFVLHGGERRLRNLNSFSNEAYPAVDFIATIPYASIVISVPIYDENFSKEHDTVPIERPNSEKDLLTKVNSNTNVKLVYDAHVRFSVRDVIQRFWSARYVNQIDFGIGVGVTGIELRDTFFSEVKHANIGDTFNQLPAGKTFEFSTKQTLNPYYYSMYADFEVGDVITVGLDAKFYNADSVNDTTVDVDGTSIKITVSYSFF
jgi:hypothetical protein